MNDRNDKHRALHVFGVATIVAVLAAAAYLTVRQPRYRKGVRATAVLHHIGAALHFYRGTEIDNPQYPEYLGQLLDEGYLLGGEYLVCRNSTTEIPSNGSEVVAGKTDFIYVGKPFDQYDSDDPIVFTKPPKEGTHEIHVLYADLGTIKTFKRLPEQLEQYVSSGQRSDYGTPSVIETLSDLFRPPTFFVIVTGIVAFFGLSWCYGSRKRPAAVLQAFLPIAVPILVVLAFFCVSLIPLHTGPFKYRDLAYKKLLLLLVSCCGIMFTVLILVKDRRLSARSVSVVSLILCMFGAVTPVRWLVDKLGRLL